MNEEQPKKNFRDSYAIVCNFSFVFPLPCGTNNPFKSVQVCVKSSFLARVFVILIGFNQCGFGLNPGTSWCTWFAFAALKQDGTVEAWGNANYGGGHVPSGLSGAIAIYSTAGALAALKEYGTVEAWGDSRYRGSGVPSGLRCWPSILIKMLSLP